MVYGICIIFFNLLPQMPHIRDVFGKYLLNSLRKVIVKNIHKSKRTARGCKCRLNCIFNFEMILSHNLIRTYAAEWLRHPSHTTRSLAKRQGRFESCTNESDCKKICEFICKNTERLQSENR